MKLQGTLTNIVKSYLTGKWDITFSVDKLPSSDAIQELQNKPLEICAKLCRKKRSLNANAYFYVLVNKIAEKTNMSDIEVHDKLLSENICYVLENEAVDWAIQNWKANKYRLVRRGDDYYYDSLQAVVMKKPDGTPYKTKDGKMMVGKIFWHIKGSHQMDTKEMARLIDSTVEEAKGLGIETLTLNELLKLKEAWK